MTTIFLMRHSRAISADYQTTDDARWLSESGRELARAAGDALSKEAGIDCIVTSPLARAVQTAEIVAHCLGYQGPIRCLASLQSEMPAQRAVEDLQSLACRAVLAISHEPIISAMSALLRGKGSDEFRAAFSTAEIRGFHGDSQVFRHLG